MEGRTAGSIVSGVKLRIIRYVEIQSRSCVVDGARKMLMLENFIVILGFFAFAYFINEWFGAIVVVLLFGLASIALFMFYEHSITWGWRADWLWFVVLVPIFVGVVIVTLHEALQKIKQLAPKISKNWHGSYWSIAVAGCVVVGFRLLVWCYAR